MSNLTPKQELFCLEYLKDFNATQAAIRAGYSKKTAGSQGHDLLKKPEIQDYLSAAKIERAEQVKVDAQWVLQRLVDEASADIAQIYDDEGNLLPVHEWPMAFRQGLVAGLEVESITDGHMEVGRLKKVRLSDRTKRLELIGKHVDVGAFAEKLVGPEGGPIQVEDKSASDLARKLAFLLKQA